jgi:hypothetical protein
VIFKLSARPLSAQARRPAGPQGRISRSAPAKRQAVASKAACAKRNCASLQTCLIVKPWSIQATGCKRKDNSKIGDPRRKDKGIRLKVRAAAEVRDATFFKVEKSGEAAPAKTRSYAFG